MQIKHRSFVSLMRATEAAVNRKKDVMGETKHQDHGLRPWRQRALLNFTLGAASNAKADCMAAVHQSSD